MSVESLAVSPLVHDAPTRQKLERLAARVPVRPGPLLDLLACSGDDPRQVIGIIERDPAMSARVLGVVNSAGCRQLHEINRVSRAILQLGGPKVRALGLAMGVQMLAEGLQVPDELLRSFWNASLRKAEAAELTALTLDPQRKSPAYGLGLIADLGLPLLMAEDRTFYVERMSLRSAKTSWSTLERAHFGVDHAQAGAYLLQRWGVAPDTVARIACHHELPGQDLDPAVSLALFIASLLPHDDNEMDPADLDRLMAFHGRVLSAAFATPDAFLGQVYTDANRRINRDTPRDSAGRLKVQPFLDAMASNTIQLIGELAKADRRHTRQREDLGNLRFEAFTDPLTKVLNRRGFFNLAELRLDKTRGTPAPAPGSGQVRGDQPLTTTAGACCMLLDLNAFKPINDRYGHDAGDLMLRGMAKLMRRSVARHDLIARMGGDEFAVLITDINEHAARVAATRLRDNCLDKRIRIAPDLEIKLSFSLGAVYCDGLGTTVTLDQLLAAADEAMYQRKRGGQPGLVFTRYAPR